MIQDKNKFKNGNKQVWKELLAVIGFMLFLGAIGILLGWSKGHLIL